MMTDMSLVKTWPVLRHYCRVTALLYYYTTHLLVFLCYFEVG